MRDTVRNGSDAAEVEVAKLNLRLLAPGEAAAGFVTLPVAHVEGLRADGSVAIPDGDLPPALTIAALPWYAGFLQEVVTGLDRIAEAHGALVLGGAGRSIENLLILELANTARPRFAHHAGAEPGPPLRAVRGPGGAGRADGDLWLVLAPVVGPAGL